MSFPVFDIGPYLHDVLNWAVPIIGLIFVAKFGIKLVFGARR